MGEKMKNSLSDTSSTNLPFGAIGVMVVLVCVGLAILAAVAIPLLSNRLPDLSVSAISGANLSPVSYDLFLEETRVNVRQGLFNANGYGGSYAIDGKVQAGVTLESPVFKVEPLGDVKYRIILPEASITFCSLNDPVQSDWSRSLVADWEKAESFAIYQAKLALIEKVSSQDIIAQTQFKVSQVLENFVAAIDNRYQLEFEFVDMGDIKFDSTCEAFKPSGYQYDILNNEWTSE